MTLIRAIIIKANMALPIIQLVGSVAIFAVCFIMFRMLSGSVENEDADEEGSDDEEKIEEKKSDKRLRRERAGRRVRKTEDREKRRSESKKEDYSDGDTAEEAVDELFEKYHLSDFEGKPQETPEEDPAEEAEDHADEKVDE